MSLSGAITVTLALSHPAWAPPPRGVANLDLLGGPWLVQATPSMNSLAASQRNKHVVSKFPIHPQSCLNRQGEILAYQSPTLLTHLERSGPQMVDPMARSSTDQDA